MYVSGSGDSCQGLQFPHEFADVGCSPDSISSSAVIPRPFGIGSADLTRTHSGPDVSRPSCGASHAVHSGPTT